MMKKLITVFVACLLPLAAMASSQRGTEAEAVAMVERAIAHFNANGLESLLAAVEDTSNADFHDRDLYVFVAGLDSIMLAHGVNPALGGEDIRMFRDATGEHFGVEMTRIATEEGTGWVDYVWANPVTNEQELKRSYIARFGDAYYLGVGVYAE